MQKNVEDKCEKIEHSMSHSNRKFFTELFTISMKASKMVLLVYISRSKKRVEMYDGRLTQN